MQYPVMVWVFWGSVGGFLALLLVWAWWLDRNARRRGARLNNAGDMDYDRRQRDRALLIETQPQIMGVGMTPRGRDAARRIWRGGQG